MRSVGIDFDILETGQVTPTGHKRASVHIAFDIKINFTQKARWVLNGHEIHRMKVIHILEQCLMKAQEYHFTVEP